MSMRIVFSLTLTLGLISMAHAEPDPRHQSVEALGNLNGVALSCRYFDQVKHIKQALIQVLPKRRELGKLFDDQTNTAFRTFVNSGEACPSPAEFSDRVGKAEQELQRVFAPKQNP